jgi:hypothetical protein
MKQQRGEEKKVARVLAEAADRVGPPVRAEGQVDANG